MGYIAQTRDLTKQYLSYGRVLSDYRPIGNTLYQPGMNVQLVPQDQQVYPDEGTVAPSGIAAGQALVSGVVCEVWPGFSGAGLPQTFLSPSSAALARGTQGVLLVVRGFCPAVLVDGSGTGAVALANGTILIPSRATAGYAQGAAAVPAVGMGTVGVAMLPSTGFGAAIGVNAALSQAAQTATVALPAAGDVINLTIQTQYSAGAPGVAQTATYSYTVLAGQTAAQVATAFAAQLNGNAGFAAYYVASAVGAGITVAVNGLSTPFLVTYGTGSTVTNQFSVSLSGSLGNSISFATSVNAPGGTTFTAGGATLAGGAGFKGYIPAFITGADC